MATSSNLYANKILKEHPLSIWPLDDTADYLSLISKTQRNLTTGGWTISGAGSAFITTSLTAPFPSSPCNAIKNSDGNSLIECKSPNIIKRSSISEDLETITISAYVFITESITNNTTVSLGFDYGDLSERKTVDIDSADSWVFVSETFEVPSYTYYDDNWFKLVISFNGLNNKDKNILINGISFGQNAEEFSATSIGANSITLPENLSIDPGQGILAESLGLTADSKKTTIAGYYIVNNGKLLAKNTGLPMVYGAQNVTCISPNVDNLPSLIVSGLGFLHDEGKTTTTSVEFWLRVNSESSTPQKIFGPISSNDGLYIDGPFLVWKIGEYYGSHYVSEWYRPMLVNISYSESASSVMINGKEVIYLSFNYNESNKSNDLSFPVNTYVYDKVTKTTNLTNDTNWLGFYAHKDIPQIEIDCFTIYSYEVPSLIAKKRWVYGQAVQYPENSVIENGGVPTVIDYTVSKYSNNYNFPAQGKWESGILEGASVVNDTLSSPTYYSLPDFYFDTKTETDWYSDTKNLALYGICLKPTPNWENVNGYMLFDVLGSFRENISSIYGVFELKQDFSGEEILFKIIDQRNSSYFIATINADTNTSAVSISYDFFSGITNSFIDLTQPATHVVRGHNFYVGLDFNLLAKEHPSLAQFFGNRQRLKVYVGGDNTFSKTFSGYIHNFSFCNSRNTSDIFNNDITSIENGIFIQDDTVYDGGSPATTSWEYAIDGGIPSTTYIYNETAMPQPFDESIITTYDGGPSEDNSQTDVINGGNSNTTTWSNTYNAGGPIPLFPAGAYNNNFMDRYATYSLFRRKYIDMFELQIAAESYWEESIPLKLLGKQISSNIYDLSYAQFNIDYPRPLSYLSDSYDTSNSLVKAFLSFQDITDPRIISFSNSVSPPIFDVIEPSSNLSELANNRYEVVDNSVFINPGLDVNTYNVIVHIEMKTDNVLKRPIRLKNLQFAGKALDQTIANPIGTKFSNDIYTHYDFEGNTQDPTLPANSYFSIHKQITPHMYLTRNSGITIIGNKSEDIETGISIPINQNKDNEFNLSSVLLALRYDDAQFPELPSLFGHIDYNGDIVDIYIDPINSSKTRAKVYALLRSTGQTFEGIEYYLNGRSVNYPVINTRDWNSLAMIFNNSLDMTDENFDYKFVITGHFTVNNITLNKDLPYVIKQHAVDLTHYYGFDSQKINTLYPKPQKIIVGDSRQLWLKNYQKAYYSTVSLTTKTLSAS